jgi:xanthine dehydrogenase small subunit
VVLSQRPLKLRDLYLGYKRLAKVPDEVITAIRFKKPSGDFRFNFEKVCKRTYLDIATVNTAISLRVSSPHVSTGNSSNELALTNVRATDTIAEAHVSAGGVGPIPMYLRETSAFLTGKEINEDTITAANDIIQYEISPISDVRGTADYKRLLLRQLFRAHFVEMFSL